MNNDELKTIKTEFDAELKRDKIYLPIAREIRKLFKDIPLELKKIGSRDDHQKALFSMRLEAIDETYHLHLANDKKAIEQIFLKNENELKKIKKQETTQLNKITKHFNQKIEDINAKREKIDQSYSTSLKDIETTYQRDVGSYLKVSQQARKKNQQVTLEIEKEQHEALEGLKKTYDLATKAREETRAILVSEFDTKKKEIDDRQSQTTTSNNEIYLSIKTDYNDFSVLFNKKINELNKQNQAALKTIKERYEAKKKPVDQLLKKLNDEYQNAISNVKESYQEDIKTLNQTFEDKKAQYEDKKARLIHEANEMISLLNSKLTAYKESANRENEELSRDLRSKIKNTDDEVEKNNYQKAIRASLKATQNDLNKQILRTNKEISQKQKDFHYRMYNHDLNYLKTINTYRLEKNLTTYNYKQSLAKIELNFNFNMAQSKAQLALIEDIYKHEEQLLILSLNHDLLSLETQLQLASLIQERELNLLTNDQQISINYSKLEHAKLEYEHQLSLEDLEFTQKQEALTYKYNQMTVNSNTQLELEKARNTRDFTIQEQQIRTDIAETIYKRRMLDLETEKQTQILMLSHEMNEMTRKHDDESFHVETKHQRLTHKRVSFMMKATLKNQQRMSISRSKQMNQYDYQILLNNQYHIYQLITYLRQLHQNRMHIRSIINELYLLPSHPESFKHCLLLAMRFDHEIASEMHMYLKDYENKARTFFTANMENEEQYRCVKKHEEMLKFYQTKTKRLDYEQKLIESEIQHIEQNYIKIQGEIDHNKAFIEQLKNINKQIKSKLLPLQTSLDYKENKKLIKNHRTNILNLKHRIKDADHMVQNKHKRINTLAKAQTDIQKRIAGAIKHLNREKQLESQFYLKHLLKHDKRYKVISKRLAVFTEYSSTFYSDLKDLVYVTNDQMNAAFKKVRYQKEQFEKTLVQTEQHLLADILTYYKACEVINHDYTKSYERIANRYLNEISRTTTMYKNNFDKANKVKDLASHKLQHNLLKNLTHQKDLLKINHQKQTQENLLTLKQLEQKLDTHIAHSKAELDALNDNQKSIANQYIKEVEMHMENHHKEHLKHINFYQMRYTNIVNDLESSNQSLINKNQILLSRYDNQHAKTLELMRNKKGQNEAQTNHHYEHISKAIDTFDKEKLQRDTKRQEELTNLQNHLKRFETKSETNQKRILSRETAQLKRNLSFKLKALKLN